MKNRLLIWSEVLAGLLFVLFLYDKVPWVQNLLGSTRGSVGIGVMILGIPLVLFVWMIQKLIKK